jgi:hypothetical protein
MAQQQADALALLAETALHHGLDPVPRASATRWWSTSTPRRWPIRPSRGSRSWKAGHAFPRKRPGAWRATPAGWSCATTARAVCGRSGPGPGRFPPLAPGPPPSGPGLPLLGLRTPLHPGASPAPLGPRRPDHALEPRVALSPASPGGTRGGLPGHALTRWGAPVPAAGWPPAP